jgi:GT2 family glycosyltransferase/glycosyltransferase involved in cell wall biosynthesis
MSPNIVVTPSPRRRRGASVEPPVLSMPDDEPVAAADLVQADLVQAEPEPPEFVVMEEPAAEVAPIVTAPAPPPIVDVPPPIVDAPPPIVDAPLPAPKPVAPIGSVDRFDLNEISGWTWDSATPDEPIEIEVVDGDAVVLRIAADRYRPDLQKNGFGDGRHGFLIRNLGGVFPFSRHLVRVRRVCDGRDLPGSPKWLTNSRLDDQAARFLDAVYGSAVANATHPDDLAQPLRHLLGLVNEVVNAHEALTRAQSSGEEIPRVDVVSAAQITDRTRELVEQLVYSYRPLHFEPTAAPVVSIVIPVFNKFSYTYDCLKSILDTLPRESFEIIIADDCSTDETLLCSLVFTGAVRVVRNARNQGFVRTCNAGAAAARGQYLLFLNNDTLMRDGWLDELVETFRQLPNIGIAGSKLLFPDGTLQEAGGIIWRLGDGWNWGRGRDPSEPGFMYLRDADWVSGAALMIPRDLFQQLRGFDEHYVPAYYEDTDIAFRVRALGKRVVVQPASQIVHLEGVSAGTDTAGTGMKRFQIINHTKFYQRWRGTLLNHRFNGDHPELEAERGVTKRAYFIDDSVPTPDQDAGSVAAVAHMRALMEMGYKVTFLPADNMSRIDPYTAQLQKLGIECLYHPFFWSVEEVFRKAPVKPDIVYLHRYSNASKYATMVRRYFPDCHVLYSVCDLHFLRMGRQRAIDPASVSELEVASQRKVELLAMENADSVVVYSPVEAALLRDVNPALKVRVVPWTVPARPSNLPFAERSGTAFIGGFGHPPNADAVRHLLDDILPLVHARLPGLTTSLIGSKMPDWITNLRVPGVRPVGFVPVIADVFHKLRATVVPLRYGAGIKGKVLESFAHGLPCVMSEIAAEGLELPDDLQWLIARSPAEFAAKMIELETNETRNAQLSAAGLAYIQDRHSAESIRAALRAAIE